MSGVADLAAPKGDLRPKHSGANPVKNVGNDLFTLAVLCAVSAIPSLGLDFRTSSLPGLIRFSGGAPFVDAATN
jgi:hypothetical protein